MVFTLEIVSPQKIEFSGEIDLCILPGTEGDFGVLKNHMPFLTSLRIGIAYLYINKKLHQTYLINGGIVEIANNKCTILSEDISLTKEAKIDKDLDSPINKDKIKALENLYYT